MSEETNVIAFEKKKTQCANCKKLFFKSYEHAYKFNLYSKILFFCSWHCLREYEKNNPEVAKKSRMRG